jgi:hypothetical protein
MSIFDDLYNWLAQRNIGAWLGLIWDPEKDKKHQRERAIRRAMMSAVLWKHKLTGAEAELAGGNLQEANRLAQRALHEVPDIDLEITNEVRAKARSIIARLPVDMDLVPPTPPKPRMSARDAFAAVHTASKFIDEGRIDEAGTLLQNILTHDFSEDKDSRVVLATYLAITACSERMKEIRKKQEAPPTATLTRDCPKCGHANDIAKQFCAHCGTPLTPSCPHCGHTCDPNDLFCSKCGQNLLDAFQRSKRALELLTARLQSPVERTPEGIQKVCKYVDQVKAFLQDYLRLLGVLRERHNAMAGNPALLRDMEWRTATNELLLSLVRAVQSFFEEGGKEFPAGCGSVWFYATKIGDETGSIAENYVAGIQGDEKGFRRAAQNRDKIADYATRLSEAIEELEHQL